MADKPEEQSGPQLATMEDLTVHLETLQEQVTALTNKVKTLEAGRASSVLEPEKAKAVNAVMAENLKTELEKQLNACKGTIKSLLFRAKFVANKGLKITGEIDMKNPADVKGKERIGSKLTETITASKNCVSTLIARAIFVDAKEKGKAADDRVRVNIKER